MRLALHRCSGRATWLFRTGKFKRSPFFKDVLADPGYDQWVLRLPEASKRENMEELRAYLMESAEPPPPPAPLA